MKTEKNFNLSAIVPAQARLFLLFAVFVLTENIYADVFSFPLTDGSEPAFQEVCAAISGKPIVKGRFTQKKTIARLNKNFISSGDFVISAEDGIIWNTKNPYPSATVITENSITQISADGKRTGIQAAGNGSFDYFSQIIGALFTGNAALLRENFTVYFEPADNGSWICGFIPIDEMIRSFAAQIVLSGSDTIRSLLLHEKNGDSISYELSDHVFASELTDDEKAFFTED